MVTENSCNISQNFSQKHFTMVALGDSNTELNHWTQGHLNWVGMIELSLRFSCKKGFTVINSGVSGNKVTDGLERLERDVLRFNPDLVVICFGTNDSSVRDDPSEFKEDLRKMVKLIKENGSEVLLRTPNPIINMLDGTELLELDGKRRMIKEYAAAVVEVAESEGVNYVDHYSLWMNSMRSKYAGEMMLLMGNCMHPNGNGHRRFYHELAPVLGLEAEFQHEFSHLLSKAAAGE